MWPWHVGGEFLAFIAELIKANVIREQKCILRGRNLYTAIYLHIARGTCVLFFYNFYQLRDPLCPLSLSRQNATERADPQALFVERRIASRTVDPQN